MSRQTMLLLATFFLLCIVTASFASEAVLSYRSATGSGHSYPKIRFWDSSGAGSWGPEIELPSAGSSVRHAVPIQSSVSSKLIIVTQDQDGTLDGYVCMANCSDASSWSVTNDFARIASGGVTERRFDLEFLSGSSDAIVVYSVYSTNGSEDIAYVILQANSTDFSGVTENYIDDSGHSSDVTYTWLRLAKSPIKNEIVLASLDSSNNDINAWVYDGSSWGQQTEITDSATQGDDSLGVTYSADGSKAMVIGSHGSDGSINYRYWDGSSWSSTGSFDSNGGSSSAVRWITLKSDPSSDDMQAVLLDAGKDLHTSYWNGSSWSITSNIDTSVDAASTRIADFDWEPTGSTGRLVWDTDGQSGSTLSQVLCDPECNETPSTISTFEKSGDFLTLIRNPYSTHETKILGIRLNSQNDIGSFVFNGTDYINYGDSAITAEGQTGFEVESISFTLFGIMPSVIINSPTNSVYTTDNISLIYTVIGTNLDSCWYTLDGSSATSLPGCANTTLSSLSNGAHNVTVYVNDSEGNVAFDIEFFSVDTQAPAVSIQSPTNSVYSTSSVPLQYTAVDSNLDSCWYVLDGGSATPLPGCANTTLSSLSNGAHNVTVYANDSAGNYASDFESFTVDTSAPAVTIYSPVNQIYATDSIPLLYTAIGPNLDSCWYTLDGGSATPLPGCANTTLSSLSEGQHNVSVYANNSAGSVGSALVDFSVDTQAPAVSIQSPTNSVYSTSSVPLQFTAVDSNIDSCWYVLDGGSATPLPSCQNTTLSSLSNGAHNVTVYANDTLGQGSSDNVSFSVNVQSEPSGGGGGDDLESLSVDYSPNCPGDTIIFKVTDKNGPVRGAKVLVYSDNLFSFATSANTDEDGLAEITLPYESQYRFKVSNNGYFNEEGRLTFEFCQQETVCTANGDCADSQSCQAGSCEEIDCPNGVVENHTCVEYECSIDSDCSAGEVCSENACIPSYECTVDDDCLGSQYCDVAQGEAGGSCADISGCGLAVEHELVEYECGSSPDCPICPDKYTCEENTCVLLNLTGPSNVTVGDNVTVKAMKGDLPCANCEILVTNPDDTTFMVTTDDLGLHTFTAQDTGVLTFVLSNKSSLNVDVWNLDTSAGTEGSLMDKIVSCALPLWILLILIGLVLFFYLRRKKKGTPEKPDFKWKGKKK